MPGLAVMICEAILAGTMCQAFKDSVSRTIWPWQELGRCIERRCSES